MNKVRSKKLQTLTEKVKKLQAEIDTFLFEEEEKLQLDSIKYMKSAIQDLTYAFDNLELALEYDK